MPGGVASHITSIGLIAPTGARSHHNIWVAKDIDPTKLAIAVSQFTQIRILILDGFSHPKLRGCEASTFVRYFSKHLMAPVLDTLFLSVMAATQRDVTRLVTSHENTLTNLHLKDVDLVYTKSQKQKKRPRYYSPWSDLFLAIRCLKNKCETCISNPKTHGVDSRLTPPWKPDVGTFEAKKFGVAIIISENGSDVDGLSEADDKDILEQTYSLEVTPVGGRGRDVVLE